MNRRVLLDEHVGRVFERVLRERGYDVSQAKDRFGEYTTDEELLRWCGENGTILLSNNAKDFERLHRDVAHAGLLLYYTQGLPDEDPEGLARTVEEVLEQYGAEELTDSLVDLEEWYDWLHE
jgi:uncharacterized protein with PIN domain